MQGLKKQNSKSTLGGPSVTSLGNRSQLRLDPANLIRSSGITADHSPSGLNKAVFMEAPSKTMKATYGFSYREPKLVIEGEPYENRPSDKKRFTRSQFIELS